jgi:GNAT superfamily N-acetyltransferase
MHYKEKPYRYLGVARHSETQEELTVYECLYENPSGTLWVRPREMFEENVQLNGKTIGRFRQVEFRTEDFTDLNAVPWQRLSLLIKEIFPDVTSETIEARLKEREEFLVQIASFEGKEAGFKISYRRDATTWESWLGGVRKEYRGLGVASSLLERLENFARERRAKTLFTKTLNQWTEMFVLNLRRGFQVVGTEASPRGLKVLLEKSLV